MKFKNYTLKKKINIILLAIMISLPYAYLFHGYYVGKFDDEVVVVADGVVVNKNIENVLGGKNRSGYNRYVVVVDDTSGVTKVTTVTRNVYYGYPIGSNIRLVETVNYVEKHNWFLFLNVICFAVFIVSILFGLVYLMNKYIKWVNS